RLDRTAHRGDTACARRSPQRTVWDLRSGSNGAKGTRAGGAAGELVGAAGPRPRSVGHQGATRSGCRSLDRAARAAYDARAVRRSVGHTDVVGSGPRLVGTAR